MGIISEEARFTPGACFDQEGKRNEPYLREKCEAIVWDKGCKQLFRK